MTGATFVWSVDGKPQIISSGFNFEIRQYMRTKHAFHTLSDKAVVVSKNGKPIWKAAGPGIQWNSITVPEHANSSAATMLMFRHTARKFSVQITNRSGSKESLRLMNAPLHRYETPTVIGAIFAFANGTDPDALILLEKRKESDSTSGVHYAFARSHYYELEAKLGEKVVWNAPQDMSQQVQYAESLAEPVPTKYASIIVEEIPVDDQK